MCTFLMVHGVGCIGGCIEAIMIYLHAVGAAQSSDEADVTKAQQQQRQKDFDQRTGDAVTETERRRLVQPTNSLQQTHITYNAATCQSLVYDL